MSAYIICVDMPCHVPVRNQLPVNIASDFTVPPAAIDVNYADHVPLMVRKVKNELISKLRNT